MLKAALEESVQQNLHKMLPAIDWSAVKVPLKFLNRKVEPEPMPGPSRPWEEIYPSSSYPGTIEQRRQAALDEVCAMRVIMQLRYESDDDSDDDEITPAPPTYYEQVHGLKSIKVGATGPVLSLHAKPTVTFAEQQPVTGECSKNEVPAPPPYELYDLGSVETASDKSDVNGTTTGNIDQDNTTDDHGDITEDDVRAKGNGCWKGLKKCFKVKKDGRLARFSRFVTCRSNKAVAVIV